jgi:Tol biopolymer transport system component
MKARHNEIAKMVFLILGLLMLIMLASTSVTLAAPPQQGSVPPPPPPPPPPPNEPPDRPEALTAPAPIAIAVTGGLPPWCCLPGVAFTSMRDGNEEIYVMRYDGSGITRLTNHPRVDRDPAPSPDGTLIAFQSARDNSTPYCGDTGYPNCVSHIYEVSVEGGTPIRLTDGPYQDTQPAWSMSGAFIAFVSNRDDPAPTTCGLPGRPACVQNIYVMNATGGAVRRVTMNPTSNPSAVNLYPNWSPDDSLIAFQSNRDGNDEIYTIAVDGSGLKRLTNNPASDGHPAWSPDGTRMAFETNRDGNYEIYVMNADGSNPVRYTTNAAADRHPIWLPGCSERIVFASDRDGQGFRIYAIDPDGKSLTRLTTLPTGQTAADDLPAWSGLPSSLRVQGVCCVPGVVVDSTRDAATEELYIMKNDGSQLTRLTFNQFRDMKPAPSPDGTRIAFQSNRDGLFQIYVMNTDGSGAKRVTNSAGNDTEPIWSTDNARIAFVSTRDDPDPKTCGTTGKPACVVNLYVMNGDGSAVTRVTNTANASNPSWSADSKRLAFQSSRDGNDEIYLVNVDGSGLTRLTNNAASDGHPTWSPEGKRIAFESNRDGKFQLYVMNADGSGVTRITDAGENRRPYWCPSCYERIVFVSNRDSGAWSTYATNSDGSNQVRLTVQLPGSTAPDDNPAWTGLPLQSTFPTKLPTPVPTPRP